MPPYTGLGSEEDSLTSWLGGNSLEPKPPRSVAWYLRAKKHPSHFFNVSNFHSFQYLPMKFKGLTTNYIGKLYIEFQKSVIARSEEILFILEELTLFWMKLFHSIYLQE